jgi:hypothetical protein
MSDIAADKHQKAAELDAAIKDGAKRKADMEGNIDKLLDAMSGLTAGMRSFQTRLDALESSHLKMHGSAHRGPDTVPTDGGSPPRSPLSNGPADSNAPVRGPFSTGDDHGKVREPGEPHPTVADSDDPDDAIFGRGKQHPLFYERQAAADTALRSWGGSAPPPMSGERLLDFRRRLLRPLLKHSKEWASVNLDELKEPLFSPIEKSVFADAIAASTDNSSVPTDYLREIITVDKSGRHISTFVGQPKAWMSAFSGHRRRVLKINNVSQNP